MRKKLHDAVDVWRAPLDLSESYVQRLRETLSDDELRRAERFHFEKDRHRYIVGRGLLRGILGHCLGEQPERLRFRYSAHGKPFLDPEFDQDLRFNMSHSHELAVYAVARCQRIGIDVEYIRPLVDAEEIARRYFSEREYLAFSSLPASVKQQAFFATWTRKESYLKAMGDGLSAGLDTFDVSVAPDQPAAMLKIRNSSEKAARWSLQDLEIGEGYVGTVATEEPDWP